MRRRRLLATLVLTLLAARAPGVAIAATLEGQVHAKGGQPLAGAEVVALVAPAAPTDDARLGRAVAGEDGVFRLEVPEGIASFQLVVRAPGSVPVLVPNAAPGVPLDLKLERGATVVGRIVTRGSDLPPPGARVTLELAGGAAARIKDVPAPLAALLEPAVTIDEQGRFRSGPLTAGAYRIRGEAPGHRTTERSDLRVGVGEERVADLSLPRDLALRGVVTGLEGPLEGAELLLVVTSRLGSMIGPRPGPQQSKTDPGGAYELHGLEVTTRYALRAAKAGFASSLREVVAADDLHPPVVDFKLEAAVVVAGTVVDDEGRPVARARVVLEDPSLPIVESSTESNPPDPRRLARRLALGRLTGGRTEIPTAPGASVRSDALGRFRVEDAAPGTWVVRLEVGGRLRETDVTLKLEAGKPVAGLIVHASLGAALEGRVVDPAGTALPGARVEAVHQGEDYASARTEADADGRFSLYGLPEGSCELRAEAAGYGAATRRVSCRATDVALALRQAGTITGRVTFEDGGSPGSVTIEARASDPEAIAPSDAVLLSRRENRVFSRQVDVVEGVYRLEGIGEGTWRLTLRHPGAMAATLEPIAVASGAVAEEPPAVLKRGASIAGMVVRRADGKPVPDVTVSPTQPGLLIALRAEAVGARTALDGSFRLEGLAPGRTTIRTTHPEYAPTVVESAEATLDGSGPPLRIEIGTGGVIEGRAMATDEVPPREPHIEVVPLTPGLRPRIPGLDADGHFRVDLTPPGRYEVSCTYEGAGPRIAPQMKGVTITGDETVTVDFAAPSGRLFGRILRGGRPVPGAQLTRVPEPSGEGFPTMGVQLVIVRADEEGRYELRGVLPGPIRVLVAERTESGFPFTVVIPDSGTLERDFELPATVVRGVVLGPDGAPAPGTDVLLRKSGSVTSARANSDGSFLLTVDAAGAYELEALRDEDRATTSLHLDVPETGLDDVRLALKVPGVVRLLVVDTAVGPLAGAQVTGEAGGRSEDARTGADGRCSLRFPVGAAVHLRVSRDGYASRTLEGVAAAEAGGEEIPVELDVAGAPGSGGAGVEQP